MKKSASCAPVTRMSPSAPTPRWRSQIAATSRSSRRTRSSTSEIRTKSFPVPLYFANLSSSISKELRQLVHERDRAALVGLEPPDPGISAEPRRLPPGQLAGSLGRALGGLVQREQARHVLDGLSVPDGLPCGAGKSRPRQQHAGLVRKRSLELRPDAALDARTEHVRRHAHPGRPDRLTGVAIPSLREA